MPSASSSSVNQTLTNYARGLSQDRASALAEFIAPTVPVAAGIGRYKSFDDKNAFQAIDTSRAIGGPAKRLEFNATDGTYNCLPQALEIPIDDQETDDAGQGDPLGMRQAKIDTLITSAIISHENTVFAALKAAVAATSGVGVWSSSSNDPVTELDEQIQAISDATGMMPNRIVFGLSAWKVFRDHDKVIARQPGASLIGLTVGQASAMLLNPGIEIKVGVLSKDTTKFGAAKSATNIVGAEVYVFFTNQNPTQYDPSFMKTFRTRRGGVDTVREYREEKSRSDILAVDWSEDIKVVTASIARRLTIS